MLWVATAFVTTMILFPNYVQRLIRGGDAVAVGTMPSGLTLVVPVEGMTCEGCTSILTNSLGKVSGVVGASVSYTDKQALVVVASDDNDMRQRIVDAVTAAGYTTDSDSIRPVTTTSK